MNRIYAQVDDRGKVIAVSQIGCDLVKIESADSRLLGTTYDPTTNTFSGVHIALTTDKAEVVAGEDDIATITATITNWNGTVSDYNGDFGFVVGTEVVIAQVDDGVAVLEFAAAEAGVCTIGTNMDAMSSGSVTVTAVWPQVIA